MVRGQLGFPHPLGGRRRCDRARPGKMRALAYVRVDYTCGRWERVTQLRVRQRYEWNDVAVRVPASFYRDVEVIEIRPGVLLEGHHARDRWRWTLWVGCCAVPLPGEGTGS